MTKNKFFEITGGLSFIALFLLGIVGLIVAANHSDALDAQSAQQACPHDIVIHRFETANNNKFVVCKNSDQNLVLYPYTKQ